MRTVSSLAVARVAVVVLMSAPGAAARASAPDPDAALSAARASCRVALARHRDTEARIACQRAFMFGGSPEDMRNNTAALVSGAAPPTMQELVVASFQADGAVRRAPGEPWGYLARCDIARRIGGREALDACLQDLARVAPGHELVAQALAAGQRAPAGIWLARAAVALALLGTLAHALASKRRRRRPDGAGQAGRAALAAVVLALSASGVASAAEPISETAPTDPIAEAPPGNSLSRIAIDDEHPETSIPSIAQQNAKPLEFGYFLQDLIARAEAATSQGDHRAAGRFYLALAKAVPHRALSYRKACESLEAAGEHDAALASCRTALARDGVTVADHGRYVELLLARTAKLTDADKAELDAVVAHLGEQKDVDAAAVPRLRCSIALRTHDVPALQACTAELARLAPDDAGTVSFRWALAVETRDRSGAAALLAKARETGMAPEALARMEAATKKLGGPGRWGYALLWALGGGVALLVLLAGVKRASASA